MILRKINVVEQAIHLKLKLEIVGVIAATLNLIKGSPSLVPGFKKRADKLPNFLLQISVLVALDLFAVQRLLVISFIRGCDDIFLEVGALHRIRRLPHVIHAGHG